MGGCFSGVEDILREVPGVIDTDVGNRSGSDTVLKSNAVQWHFHVEDFARSDDGVDQVLCRLSTKRARRKT